MISSSLVYKSFIIGILSLYFSFSIIGQDSNRIEEVYLEDNLRYTYFIEDEFYVLSIAWNIEIPKIYKLNESLQLIEVYAMPRLIDSISIRRNEYLYKVDDEFRMICHGIDIKNDSAQIEMLLSYDMINNKISILDTFHVNFNYDLPQGDFSDIDQPYVNENGVVEYFELDFTQNNRGNFVIDSLKRVRVMDDKFIVNSVSVYNNSIGLHEISNIWNITYDQDSKKYIFCELNSCVTVDKHFTQIENKYRFKTTYDNIFTTGGGEASSEFINKNNRNIFYSNDEYKGCYTGTYTIGDSLIYLDLDTMILSQELYNFRSYDAGNYQFIISMGAPSYQYIFLYNDQDELQKIYHFPVDRFTFIRDIAINNEGEIFGVGEREYDWDFYFILNDDYEFIITSVKEKLSPEEISIYPNPTQNSLKIEHPDEVNFLKYSIIDITGKQYKSGNYSSRLDVDDLTPGTYLLVLKTSASQVGKKFIKL